MSSGEKSFLLSTNEFADFELKLEFRAPATTNSGIFLRTVAPPADPAADCYELNIAGPETSPFYTGSFVGRAKATPWTAGPEWQAFHVTAQGDHWQVKLNGEQVLNRNVFAGHRSPINVTSFGNHLPVERDPSLRVSR